MWHLLFTLYVGETIQMLDKRFNGHTTRLSHPEKHDNYRMLSFNIGIFKRDTFKIQILEKHEGTGRTI